MRTEYKNYRHHMYKIAGIDIIGYDIVPVREIPDYYCMELYVSNKPKYKFYCKKEQMEKIAEFIKTKVENCDSFYVVDLPDIDNEYFNCTIG